MDKRSLRNHYRNQLAQAVRYCEAMDPKTYQPNSKPMEWVGFDQAQVAEPHGDVYFSHGQQKLLASAAGRAASYGV